MKKLKFLLATPALVAFFALFQIETVAQVKETKNTEKEKIKEVKLDEKSSNQKNENLNQNQLSEKEQDFLMLLDTVEKDLEILKTDRKTFDKVASKFPIVINGILMNKKDLKNFDTSRIKSVHIDAGNPEKGTIVNLSTNDDDNSGSRMFTFKIADDNSDKPSNKILINGKESTEEEVRNHINKINQQKKDSLSSSNNIQVQKINYKDTHVTIKGIGSSSNQKIIYIVDGKEINSGDFNKIHPNDIERIDVLKDKKAIEKYGDKAKDGVIVVTTKAKKEVSLQQKTQALKARELAMKQRNEIVAERNEIEKRRQQLLKKRNEISEKAQQRRKELEEQREKLLAKRKETIVVSNKNSDKKQLEEDYKTLNDLFKDVSKTVKDVEDENFKITSVRASITREDGTKVELAEVY